MFCILLVSHDLWPIALGRFPLRVSIGSKSKFKHCDAKAGQVARVACLLAG